MQSSQKKHDAIKRGDIVKLSTSEIVYLHPTLSQYDEYFQPPKIALPANCVGVVINTLKLNDTIKCRIMTQDGIGWTNSLLLELV